MTKPDTEAIGGYAPGSYMCHCCSCGKDFLGDKRSLQCYPCAVADDEKFNAMTPEEQQTLIERNIKIVNEVLKKKL